MSAPTATKVRRCGCGGVVESGGECAACQAKRLRRRATAAGPEIAPPSVHDVIGSRGRPLDPAVRSDMEARLGHDFSRVRVHTGPRAAESARDVSALAYTVGPDIVFGAGRYSPASEDGRHLLAHELAHVVQEPSPPPRGGDLVVGRTDDPVERRAGAVARTVAAGRRDPVHQLSTPSTVAQVRRQPAPPAPAAEKEPEQGFVERMIIECKGQRDPVKGEGTLVMVTRGGNHVFEMNRCQVPPGLYTATITHKGPWARITLHTGEAVEVDFSKREKQKGFRSPAELLAGQNEVPVEVNQSVAADIEAAMASHEPAECLLSERDHDVIDKQSLTYPLLDHTFRDITLWSHKVPLGFFGALDVALTAGARAKSQTDGYYGPGTLHDICMLKVLPSPKNMLEGYAQFTFPARIDLFMDVEGWLKLVGDFRAGYLLGVELANAKGDLGVNGHVALDMLFDAGAKVLYNVATGDYTLAGAATVDGYAALDVGVDAGVALTVLGFTLWKASWHWDPVDTRLDWHAGMTIGQDLSVSFDNDQAKLAGNNPGPKGKKQKSKIADFASAVSAVADEITSGLLATKTDTLADKKADVEKPDGSKEHPEPFIWYKPARFYVDPLTLPDAPDRKRVGRRDGPTFVAYPSRYTSRSEQFGVEKDNWPVKGDLYLYQPKPEMDKDDLGERSEQHRFKRVTEGLGFDWSRLQPDHVRDLQFGGRDSFVNLWPLDATQNLRAGAHHLHQLQRANSDGALQKAGNYYFEIIDITSKKKS